MPQENGDPTTTIQKILRLEHDTGYRNLAVTGGLEMLIERLLPEAKPLVAGYADSDHFGRQRMIARLREQLDGASQAPSEEPAEESPQITPVDSGEERSPAGPVVDLDAPVTGAVGVGAKRASMLAKLGVESIRDLLCYLPRRLEDRSTFVSIGSAPRGAEAAIRGRIAVVDQRRMSRRMNVVKAAVGDGTGFLYAVWFNQPWIAQQLKRGEEIDLFGRIELAYGELQMKSPVWEPAGTGLETGRWVPVYPATEGVSDKAIRALIERNLDVYLPGISEVLPEDVRAAQGLPGRRAAIEAIHRPRNAEDFESARRTLAFEELFLLQLGLLSTTRSEAGASHKTSGSLASSFLAGLSLELTAAQRTALSDIESDLEQPIRMMRLLQGDVGSGKTLVAVVAALHVIEAGYQVAMMAPTELLAAQHAATLSSLLEGLPVEIALLTGSTKEKSETDRRIEEGEVDLIVGTHALIQESVSFARLGLVVIDEQHRFGVVQRAAIEEKGTDVDLLVMSATPIPRTIALTLYGEFDTSILDELPMGEKRITTYWLAESRRDGVYDQVARAIRDGSKGYVVLPLVEESDKVSAKAAVQVSEELTAKFPDLAVGLLHGRMSAREKSVAMTAFRDGEIQLLVATSVIEVGIDVLDADLMVIEHADRFGLSQLHQLRGRIGRAGQEATCFAIADAGTEDATRRLKAFTQHLDGFAIAEEDLRIRGPGDLLGTQQHGYLTQLRAVDLISDLDLMHAARQAARGQHQRGLTESLRTEIERRFGELLRWLRV